MGWFNIYGLIFMAVIMIPNIIYAMKCRDGFQNTWSNKAVELLEQIGRFGCFALMIFNVTPVYFGFASDTALTLYLIVNSALLLCYCVIWIFCFRSKGVFKALALSVIPSAVFLFSGIISRSPLLIAAAVIFAPCHITISYKNAEPPISSGR